MQWIQHQIQAATDIPDPTRLELRTMLERLRGMDPDDTTTIPAWQRVREAAPKVWKVAEPVLGKIVGEAVKKALGL